MAMAAITAPAPTNPLKPSKRPKTGGRPPSITKEIAERVAENMANGLSLRMALRKAHPDITTVHWSRTLERESRIASAFECKEAEVVSNLLDEMDARARDVKRGQWTQIAWILERRWRDDYGQKPGGGTNVNVQVNTLVGLGDDVLRRASTFIKRSERTISVSNSTEKEIQPPK